MPLFYRRLSPAAVDNEWAPPIPLNHFETRWMRMSPGRELGGGIRKVERGSYDQG